MQEEVAVIAKDNEGEAEYDAQAIRILRRKQIIAPILQMVVSELKECSQEEIIKMIESVSFKTIPVGDLKERDLSEVDPVIIGDDTVKKSQREKTLYFDLVFRMLNPKLSNEDILVNIIIDMEVQNDYYPGYPIVKRGIYYLSRAISEQLSVVTKTRNYNKIVKVYSIWICNKVTTPELKNTMTRYRINKEDIVGDTNEPPEDYDLMELIIIRRGEDASNDKIFQYLDAIFKSDILKMKKYSTVEWPEEVEKEVQDMYGFGAALVKEAEERAEMRTENRMNKEIAARMILKNQSIESIAEFLNIPVQKAAEIVAELKNN